MTEKQKLFLRDATGLVKAWGLYDSFVYSVLAIPLVTLGWYTFSFGPFIPQGNFVTGFIVSDVFIFFEVIAYSMLIAVMPRTGGDYVWQSRVFSGSIGFVLVITGYVFTLWQWGPIYGNFVSIMVFAPIAAILGNVSAAVWWTGSAGVFTSSILTIILAAILMSLGMGLYARVQKWCFHIGMVGVIVTFAVLAANSQPAFQPAFNSFTNKLFGTSGDSYTSMIQLAQSGGLSGQSGITDWNLLPSLGLIPFLAFFNIYPIWGAALGGEVRGSNDFKRNLKALTGALVFTTILAIIGLFLFAYSFGWLFYNSANYVYWGTIYAYNPSSPPFPIFAYPGLLAGILANNVPLALFILIALSFWYWGSMGTLFLSSTRVLFAASFDRILPAKLADVNERVRSPLYAVMAMAIPTAILSYLYAFVTVGGVPFASFSLDAALVLVVMYFGTAIAAAVLPFRKKDLYESSPVARYRVGGVPLITIAGVIMALFMAWLTYEWAVNPVYGVNNPYSAVYVLMLYLIAIALYFGFKTYRKRQGFDIGKIYSQIPVE